MTTTEKYQGRYTDQTGSCVITIENDFDTLSVEIDGIRFQGREFDDLVIISKEKYTDAQLKRFTFSPTPVYQTEIIDEALCNCRFELIVPQVVIDNNNASETQVDLSIIVSLGIPAPPGGLDFEHIAISLNLNERVYTAKSDLIDGAFELLNKQFDGQYHFKNCYGCMFGDYSVAGQSMFGMMLCFVRQQAGYRLVTNKDEYMILTDDVDQVQEIYCCSLYTIREIGVGYRR